MSGLGLRILPREKYARLRKDFAIVRLRKNIAMLVSRKTLLLLESASAYTHTSRCVHFTHIIYPPLTMAYREPLRDLSGLGNEAGETGFRFVSG